jgi:ribosomal protein S18 acetylase RimI-like enzyme
MKIRYAAEADVPALVEFNQAMALETEGKSLDPEVLSEGVAAVFGDPDKGFYVVAEDEGGQVAGGLMVTYEWSDWRAKWFWWIQSVYVRPEHRGKHLYSRLYGFVRERGAEAGNVCGFRLYVETGNTAAQRVYEHLGMHRPSYVMYEENV